MIHDDGAITALLVVVLFVASTLIGLAVLALRKDRRDKERTPRRQKTGASAA